MAAHTKQLAFIKHTAFLMDLVHKAFWMVLPKRLLKKHKKLLKNLRISLMGVFGELGCLGHPGLVLLEHTAGFAVPKFLQLGSLRADNGSLTGARPKGSHLPC
jgi:hypothetical protein